MPGNNLTLTELFNLKKEPPTFDQKVRSDFAAAEKEVAITTVAWPLLEDKILETLVEMFDLKLLDLCLTGWRKYEDLQEYADRKKHPLGEKNEVPLAEHEIISKHRPKLEISVGKYKKTLAFDLNACLKLEDVVLQIQDGRIKGVQPGTCGGEATLEWENVTLIKAKTKNIRLGEPVPLGEGIVISPE
jgi:hypothetical protein